MIALLPLWELQNAIGFRTLCYVRPVQEGFLLLLQRDGHVLLSERHDAPGSAIDRADAIFGQLTDQGWTLVVEGPPPR